MGGCWRWAVVCLDGVAPRQMVNVRVSASVNLPKSRSSLLALANQCGPRKRAVKRVWCSVRVAFDGNVVISNAYK